MTHKQIPRGQRTDFIKTGISLPPEMMYEMKQLGLNLRKKGVSDTDFSSLAREAIRQYLTQENKSAN